MKKIILLSFIITTFVSNVFSAAYNWNGSVSSDWSNSNNWTPAGIPGVGDDIIVIAAANNCILDATRTIDALTLTSGILNLNGFQLNVTQNATFTNGNATNGTLSIASSTTNTTRFDNSVFDANLTLNVVSGRIILNGGIFNGLVNFEQTGTTDTGGNGNATFNNKFNFTLSGSGYFRTSGNITFNDSTTLINNGSNYILLELNSGNTYNGFLKIINNSTSSIRVAYRGDSHFYNNIEFNNTNTGRIQFCEQATATATLHNGVVLTIGSLGFTNGTLYLYNISQTDATPQNLTLGGTYSYMTINNCHWAGNISFVSPQFNTNNSIYDGTTSIEKTDSTANYSGGNTFNSTTVITNSSNLNSLRFGRTNPDIFNGDLTLNNTNNGQIRLADNTLGNVVNGKLTINNNSSNSIYICDGSPSSITINGNIELNQTASSIGIYIGNKGNNVTQTIGNTITIGGLGVDVGTVRFTNFVQQDVNPINLNFSGTTFFVSRGSTWTGNLAIASPQLIIDSTLFNGNVTLNKTGATNNASFGGNKFLGNTTIINSGTAHLYFANNLPDSVMASLSLITSGSGNIYLANNSLNNLFNGNISINYITNFDVLIGNGGSSSSTLSAGRTISVLGAGASGCGDLYIRRFSQLGATPQNIILNGTALLFLGPTTTFNGNLTAAAPQIYSQESTYNGVVYLEKTGATNNYSAGGNRFLGLTTVANSGTANFLFGNTAILPDTFQTHLTINNTGTGQIYFSHTASNNYFGGNIVLNSTNGGGIRFGENGGSSTILSGNTISVGGLGFSEGTLRLRYFTQLGATPQNLTLTTNGYLLLQESTWNGNVSFSSPRFYTTGTTFNGTAYLEKTGATDDNSAGGNTFNATTTLVNSGSGAFRMGSASTQLPDIYNGITILRNTGSSWLLVADYTIGNQFNNNIIVEATSGSGINFGRNNGTATLAASQTITVGGLGFNIGELRFKNFTQLSATPQNITLTGTGYILNQSSTWNGNLNFISPRFYTATSTYNGTVYFEKNGATNDDSYGGNTFNQNTTIVNAGTGRIRMGTTTADIFNNDVLITNTGSNYILMADASVGNQFNGNITVNSTAGSGINFGRNNGTATLAASQTITVGGLGFNIGELRFKNFTQLSATPQNITLTGTGYILNQSSTWNGNLNFISPRFYTATSTYNGTVYFEKNGATDDDSYGGNTFNQNTTIVNAGTGRIRMGTTAADTFMGNATFRKNNTGLMYPTYNTASTYYGNINIESNTAITFGAATNGRVIFEGTASQQINDLGASPTPIFTRLTTNKTSGEVTLNIPITVSVELNLLSGNIISSNTNLLTMNNGSTVSAVSNSAYVSGPIRKIGNTAFTFPIGKGGFYRPSAISAPTNTTHHFTAEYFLSSPDVPGFDRTLKDVSIDHISDCEYWIIDRTNGTSNVTVTLSWDTTSCGVTNLSDLVVARWDGSQWKDHGNGGTTGTTSAGTILTAGSVTSFSPFTLASSSTANPLPISLLSFDAKLIEQQVDLNWITTTEINNDFFSIERSANLENWELIKEVKGAGNSNTNLTYSILDQNPLTGISYYRLKQTDFNGEFTYSDIVVINNKGLGDISIYPNPVKDVLNVKTNCESCIIKVYSAIGQLIHVGSENQINTNNWANGAYEVVIINNDGSFLNTKVIK